MRLLSAFLGQAEGRKEMIEMVFHTGTPVRQGESDPKDFV